jgi:light-independent protochlorophyllide reductase subunit B
VCLYPEIAESSCAWLERSFGIPFTSTVPIGIGATQDFLVEVHNLLGMTAPSPQAGLRQSRLPWYSESVDSTYLTGKRVFIFGDGTHALAAARICKDELGFEVVGLGTYSREMARPVRAAAKAMGLEALISDDYLEVEAAMAAAAPELVLGTQMERHSAKRLGLPCAVISTPMHVQDVPARNSPQMGWEGANVIFDSWVHPLMMGLEEHLIGMFRHDFEFVDGHQSHLGHAGGSGAAAETDVGVSTLKDELVWTADGEAELKKIPFFVRGKVRRNTETFAKSTGRNQIDSETLYDAKAHFSA